MARRRRRLPSTSCHRILLLPKGFEHANSTDPALAPPTIGIAAAAPATAKPGDSTVTTTTTGDSTSPREANGPPIRVLDKFSDGLIVGPPIRVLDKFIPSDPITPPTGGG
jgi:hypothetical protein